MALNLRRPRGTALLLVFLAGGCAPADAPQAVGEAQAAGLPEGHPPIGGIGAVGTALTGVVKETVDGGGYTYALLDIGDRELWVAGPLTALTVGEVVALPDTMNMGVFTAESLGRTFEELYFTGKFSQQVPGEVVAMEFTGTVAEAIHSAGYTYLRVHADGDTIWLAAPEMQVEVGQTVGWNGGMAMQGFRSSSLDRTFETLYFVEAVTVQPGA